ncbi:DNA helicase [Acuticoccus sp. M5D2P5]|uniref:DNA helicase n=1 Tax=Acuticoccus kalidii TaxID=2910977 RepID=UPI001F362A1E|nr:DNA helicase [Acuticoccus kalidii]MCF3935218.1 DNA helicase [Acuticoccus kalidii]
MRLSAPIYQLKRRAKALARQAGIPLHAAQDRLAHDEGFATWSLLAARHTPAINAASLLPALREGEMILVGARPGHGKTLFGIELLVEAARAGRRAVFFTLEYSEREALRRVGTLGGEEARLEIVASDAISADFIVRHLDGAPRGTVAVIDYLQILDQQRSKPVLAEQMRALKAFAARSGVIFGFISQIDRSFDPRETALPGVADVRLPNPVPDGLFTKAYFLHGGMSRLHDLA